MAINPLDLVTSPDQAPAPQPGFFDGQMPAVPASDDIDLGEEKLLGEPSAGRACFAPSLNNCKYRPPHRDHEKASLQLDQDLTDGKITLITRRSLCY
jgi:hypothetical protein